MCMYNVRLSRGGCYCCTCHAYGKVSSNCSDDACRNHPRCPVPVRTMERSRCRVYFHANNQWMVAKVLVYWLLSTETCRVCWCWMEKLRAQNRWIDCLPDWLFGFNWIWKRGFWVQRPTICFCIVYVKTFEERSSLPCDVTT